MVKQFTLNMFVFVEPNAALNASFSKKPDSALDAIALIITILGKTILSYCLPLDSSGKNS